MEKNEIALALVHLMLGKKRQTQILDIWLCFVVIGIWCLVVLTSLGKVGPHLKKVAAYLGGDGGVRDGDGDDGGDGDGRDGDDG